MSDTYLNSLVALDYFDPVPVLEKYRELELIVAASDLSGNVRSLRTPGLRFAREGREGALFAVALERILGNKVFIAPVESADHDFVLRWTSGGEDNYCPVQLKELVSEERNPGASLRELLERSSQRPASETVLLVRLNRKESIDISDLSLETVPFREVWFIWQSSPDGSHWSVLGDAKSLPLRYDFPYPGEVSAR